MWKEMKSGFALIVDHQRKIEFNNNIYLFLVYYFRTFFKGSKCIFLLFFIIILFWLLYISCAIVVLSFSNLININFVYNSSNSKC